MKNTGTWPKCNGKEIYCDSDKSKSGDRCAIPVSSWSKLFIDTYICLDCGYLEEYLDPKDLKDSDKVSKIKVNFKKHPGNRELD